MQQQTQVKFAQQELDRTSALVPKGLRDGRAARSAHSAEQRRGRRWKMPPRKGRRGAARARRRDARCRALPGQHRRQCSRRAEGWSDRIPCRQCRRGAAGRRQGLHDARRLLCLHGHLSADRQKPAGSGSAPRRASCSTPIPRHVIPAKVVFVASQAQFTPKTVETKDERDKLMFRIRVRIDPERLEGRAALVRSGLPGVAYVRTDPSVAWPASLSRAHVPALRRVMTAASGTIAENDWREQWHGRAHRRSYPTLRKGCRPRWRHARDSERAAWSG